MGIIKVSHRVVVRLNELAHIKAQNTARHIESIQYVFAIEVNSGLPSSYHMQQGRLFPAFPRLSGSTGQTAQFPASNTSTHGFCDIILYWVSFYFMAAPSQHPC